MEVVQGDLTQQHVDAVVNAANRELQGGGGVDGAIHRAGGPSIMEECRRIGGCPTGEAVVTTAGELPARWVIHTVGPVWQDGQQGEPGLLKRCYRHSLERAVEVGAASVAFPNISTGVYGYPKREAAEIAVEQVARFLQDHERSVLFVCFDRENAEIYQSLLG